MKVRATVYDFPAGSKKPAIRFTCPGCGHSHVITYNGAKNNMGAGWDWNGSFDRPTITPSIKSTSEWDDSDAVPAEGWGPWHVPAHLVNHPTLSKTQTREVLPSHRHLLVHHKEVCHSYVTDGKIRFLGDCTHKLVGQTVELPEMPLEEA